MTLAQLPTTNLSPRDKFYDVPFGQPHTARAMEILEKHPEIAELFNKPEWRTKWYILATVLIQTCMAMYVADKSWPVFIAAAYIIGATCHQSLFVCVHELSHYLSAQSKFWCRSHSILANLPIGIPFVATFEPYHYDHHRFQGQVGHDTDIPTEFEAHFFTHYFSYNYYTRCLGKAVFMFNQILFYALRPMIVKPEVVNRIKFTPYYLANTVVCIAYDATLVYCFGIWSLVYLLLSTFFGGSIHPLSGHYLSEHYIFDEFKEGEEGFDETFSYYGWPNAFMYNVGYHCQHHDFPNIAWTNLPKLNVIAPEYYLSLPSVDSWTTCVYRYIFDDRVTPFCRVRREYKRYEVTDSAPIQVDKSYNTLRPVQPFEGQ